MTLCRITHSVLFIQTQSNIDQLFYSYKFYLCQDTNIFIFINIIYIFFCARKKMKVSIVCKPPPPSAGGELSLQPNFQKGRGGLTGPQLEIAGKEGVIFYKGVEIFTKK